MAIHLSRNLIFAAGWQMKVIVADQSGVCFGVKRALDLVVNESRKGPLATLGPLIHNPQVVGRLAEDGVRIVESIQEVSEGRIVMPSHGVPSQTLDEAQAAGLQIIDATCPFVANVHRRVSRLAAEDYLVVIIGDAGHSEVKAIRCAAGKDAIVISSSDEVSLVHWSDRKVGVVSQTTQTPERFGEIVGKISQHVKEMVVHNTICYATYNRQSAARLLSREVDAMFVVGGRNSANTNRLAEICREEGVRTYHIETADEIDVEAIRGLRTIGLTAGASTPNWIIDDVKARLESL
jgi:small subunit ribosomal protein S1